jgi:hypothetical protein
MYNWLIIKNYGFKYKYVEPVKVTHPVNGDDIIYGRRTFGRNNQRL